jgi:hypothetical protein
MEEVKGLPRATFNYHKIKEMGEEGAASNHPLINKKMVEMGE